MDNQNTRAEAQEIISELFDEFSKEEMKLKVKYDNNCAKLEEMDQQIRMMSRSVDTEMRVFSPRRHISTENDKVTGLKKEREELDKQNRETERNYRYYSKRADKLRHLMELMERDEGVFIENVTTEDFSVETQTKEAEEKSQRDQHIEDIEKIQKKLDNCYHFIDSDTQRCKMEIKNLMIMVAEWLEGSI